jgi:hypothetical protein
MRYLADDFCPKLELNCGKIVAFTYMGSDEKSIEVLSARAPQVVDLN